MAKLFQIVFVACAIAWPIAWWNGDKLPATMSVVQSLAADPQQSPIQLAPMNVAVDGVGYRVEPTYRYALDGLVVSYRVHDAAHLLHRLWNDHLNVADICVVWGHDVHDVDLHAFDFSNGEFTCNFRTRSDKEWRAFRLDQISNNHLITDDPALRRRIADVAVGDVVHIEGYLSAYSNGDGFHRGTSTTREDTGNGACETTYVTGFEIVEPAPRGWRRLQSIAGWGMLLSAAAWLLGVATGRF